MYTTADYYGILMAAAILSLIVGITIGFIIGVATANEDYDENNESEDHF